jgi:metal-responsive CopG/Arc/MetJ family transcriptional regulator
MKTAVSIPDTVFARAERFARRLKKSRSRIVSDALQEYLARHCPDEVTEAMDRAVGLTKEQEDRFVSSAATRTLKQVEW